MPPRTTLDEHRILVQELFPTIDVRSFDRIGSGWTYDTYDVNDEWIVQIPRSTYAAERLVAQSTLLPGLAREVSALIPVPSMISSDPPAMVYPKLHGVPADRAPEGFWPERLGRFLYDLHMVPPEFVGLRAQPPEVVRGQIREEIASLAGVVVPRLDPGEASRAEAMVVDVRSVPDARGPRTGARPRGTERRSDRRPRLGRVRDRGPGMGLRLVDPRDAERGRTGPRGVRRHARRDLPRASADRVGADAVARGALRCG
jgi:hypothetical protein